MTWPTIVIFFGSTIFISSGTKPSENWSNPAAYFSIVPGSENKIFLLELEMKEIIGKTLAEY